MKVDLAALVELEKRATPGPWGVDRDDDDEEWVCIEANGTTVVGPDPWDAGGVERLCDAALIAALRNAAPALIAVAKAAREWKRVRESHHLLHGDIEAAFKAWTAARNKLDDAVRALVGEE